MSALSLREAYYRLRMKNDALAAHGHRFEFQPWTETDDAAVRTSPQGWWVRMVRNGKNIEAHVTPPSGPAMIYAAPEASLAAMYRRP